MLSSLLVLAFFRAPSTPNSVASRQIAAPCSLIEERASRWFSQHKFSVVSQPAGDAVMVAVQNRKGALEPSGRELSLTRTSIRNYTLPRHLSHFKVYDNFQLDGHLKLVTASEAKCDVTFEVDITAYEFSWVLAAIDDGYRSKFTSNGALECLYLDAIVDLISKPED